MKKLLENLIRIDVILFILLILKKPHYIKPSLLCIIGFIFLTLKAILGLYEYKETKNKIELIIPILFPFFILALIIIELRS